MTDNTHRCPRCNTPTRLTVQPDGVATAICQGTCVDVDVLVAIWSSWDVVVHPREGVVIIDLRGVLGDK
jgi:hypothetical protein